VIYLHAVVVKVKDAAHVRNKAAVAAAAVALLPAQSAAKRG